jgi:hypothetical protein
MYSSSHGPWSWESQGRGGGGGGSRSWNAGVVSAVVDGHRARGDDSGCSSAR